MAYLVDRQNQFYALLNESGTLVAFCSFGADGQVFGGDYSQPALDIGMGIRPDLTGRGLGSRFRDAVSAFAVATFQPPRLRVTVAEFNQRALRLWQNGGFRQTQRFVAPQSQRPFIILVNSLNL